MAKAEIGQQIVFIGYGPDVPEDQRILADNTIYEVHSVDEAQQSVGVLIENPGFDPKKKESEANARNIIVDVFEEEFDLYTEEGGEEAQAEAAPEPAPPARTRGKAATPAATPAAAAPKATAKAPAKSAAKPAPKAPAAAAEQPAEEVDKFGDLTTEQEDQEILQLVNDSEDILALAASTAEEAANTEYRLGGILFHVRQSKAYEALDERYKESKGFALYCAEQLHVEYRKAMYLIQIYYAFNKYGVEGAWVAQMGWAKASKIAAVMDDENAAALVDLASTNTLEDLNSAIKEGYRREGGTAGEAKKMTTYKFRLFQEQAASVTDTLNAVQASMGFKRVDDAFQHIVMEWATEHHIGEAPAAAAKPAVAKAAAPTKPVAAKPAAPARPVAAKPAAPAAPARPVAAKPAAPARAVKK